MKDIPDLRLTKVFSDAALTWGDAATQQLIVRRIGTFRERFNIVEGKIDTCESNAFTLEPNDISCTHCNDLDKNSRFESNLKLACNDLNGIDISEK